MDSQFTIRPTTLADAEILCDLGPRTYIASHGPFITSKDELNNYLRQNYALDVVRGELSNPSLHFFIAFAASGRPVGFLKLRPCALPVPQMQPDSQEIQRLYIDDQMQGKGIGKALMHSAYTLLRDRDIHHVYIGVYEGNAKAIAFYTKLGGILCGQHTFYVGNTGYINPIYQITF